MNENINEGHSAERDSKAINARDICNPKLLTIMDRAHVDERRRKGD